MICSDCPRKCGAFRGENSGEGFCGCPELPLIVRASPHFGEEPCISGSRGSGAVFFSGCSLRCSFCQNSEISRLPSGKSFSPGKLAELLNRLQDSGVHNINLVTASHYIRPVAEALEKAKLKIPVVWNSSGYELPESLRLLNGLVQVYMPDYKYSDSGLAARLSRAPDYPETAAEAIEEMFSQRGAYRLSADGMLESGVLIRHLIIPGETENSMGAMDFAADNFGEAVLFSLMSQFTPMNDCGINRGVNNEENEALIHYMKLRRLSGYCQELCSATREMIPDFSEFSSLKEITL